MFYVYAVICHKLTNPLIFTVKNLLKSSYSKVILHIDRKTPETEVRAIKETLGNHENLLFVSDKERIDVQWGNVSQIEVILLLLRLSQLYNFHYLSIISGDDIPLCSNQERETFLSNAFQKKIEFMGINPKNDAIQRLSIKYPSFFFKKDHSVLGKLCKKFFLLYAKCFCLLDISSLPKLYKGSSWFTLTNDAVIYILEYISKNPCYLFAFQYSFCGDEVFFQTIIYNSSFSEKIYERNINLEDCERGARYIDWLTGPDYPRTLDESDFDKMKKSGLLFARKINPHISMDALEKFLYKKET